MKPIYAVFACFLFFLFALGGCKGTQKLLMSSPAAYPDSLPDGAPRFPGGEDSLAHYLAAQLQFSAQAWNDSLFGKALCSFWIEEDGSLSAPEILQGVSPEFDTLAIAVLRTLPRWSPAIRSGKPVRFRCATVIALSVEDAVVSDSISQRDVQENKQAVKTE